MTLRYINIKKNCDVIPQKYAVLWFKMIGRFKWTR